MRTSTHFTPFFSGLVSKFQLKSCIFFAILFLGILSTSIAQTFPPTTSCTSKDLEIVGATLSGGDICSSCTVGTPLTRTLTLSIKNTTGSNRTAFAFWGTLEITDGTTGVTTSTAIQGCNDVAIPPNTSALPPNQTSNLSFDKINYKCGDILKITNLYLAWTDASPKSTCPLDPSTIAPKCGTLPSIQINAGVNATSAITDVLCFGANTGVIDLSPFGGTGTFTYSWSASNGGVIPSGQSTSQDLTGLKAGTYTVVITDQNGCTATKIYTVTQPSAGLALGECSKTDVSCAGGDGSVTAGAVTNAVGTVDYSWRNSSNTVVGTNATVTNLPAGTYTLTVTDNCFSRTCSVTVDAPPAITTPEATVTKQPDCSTATGTVTVSSPLTGNTYTLTQNGVIKYTAANGIFTSVASGTYIINVTNGICSATGSSVTVNAQPSTPDAPVSGGDQAECAQSPIQTLTATATGGTITWYDAASGGSVVGSPTLNTVGSVTYYAESSDGSCSSLTRTAVKLTINNGATPPVSGGDQAECAQSPIQTLTATATGGTITWYDAASGGSVVGSPTLNTVGSVTYYAQSSDGNCSSLTRTAVKLTINAAPDAPTATVTQPTCSLGSGSISVTNLGTGYTYGINGSGYQQSNVFSGLIPGVYTVTVKNAAGCISSGLIITINAAPASPAAPMLSVVQPTCKVASATITVTSATEGLQFSLDGGPYAPYPTGGYTVTAIGTHTISAKNSGGCVSKDASVTVNKAPLSCAPLYSYTQGYYHNTGMGCTPTNGSLTASQLVQLSLDNMDGILGNNSGTLYLGRPGASISISYNDAAKLQSIMPGGGKATKLSADYNLSSNIYPPLKNGRINNILLSQTITLALNVSIPNNGLSAFKLEEGYLTTMTKSGSSCTAEVATCENGGTMSSLKITNNQKLMDMLKGKTVQDLLNMASAALGGVLPAGVSYDDISGAVDVINRSFDEGRYSLGYNAAPTTCGILSTNIQTTTTVARENTSILTNDKLTVSTSPNPFDDKVTFTIESTVSGNAVLSLYDVMGVKLATIYQGYLSAGTQTIKYNAPSKFRGTLIYTLTVGNMQTNGKIIRVK